jgi:hypothetical protein
VKYKLRKAKLRNARLEISAETSSHRQSEEPRHEDGEIQAHELEVEEEDNGKLNENEIEEQEQEKDNFQAQEDDAEI